MKFRGRSKAVWPVLLSAALVTALSTAKAQNPVNYVLTGEIVSVEDSLNWFNDAYTVGAPVTGTYKIFDSGYRRSTFNPELFMGHEYFSRNNPFGYPVLFPQMRIRSGAREVRERLPGLFNYQVNVWNDSTEEFPGLGDGYHVGSPMAFPTFFNDWSGDPTVDPDGNFSPTSSMALRLTDPAGGALSSLDLPLANLDLSAFQDAFGYVFIWDLNSGENYAVMQFRINTLQAVPEPGSLALLIGASAVGASVLRCRRRA